MKFDTQRTERPPGVRRSVLRCVDEFMLGLEALTGETVKRLVLPDGAFRALLRELGLTYDKSTEFLYNGALVVPDSYDAKRRVLARIIERERDRAASSRQINEA